MRYCTHSSVSRSLFAENFRCAAWSARISCSAISRQSTSFRRGRLRGGSPTLQWRANLLPRLAPSGFFTRLTPNQQTKPWQGGIRRTLPPDLVIIFTLRRRPLGCSLLPIDASTRVAHTSRRVLSGCMRHSRGNSPAAWSKQPIHRQQSLLYSSRPGLFACVAGFADAYGATSSSTQ